MDDLRPATPQRVAAELSLVLPAYNEEAGIRQAVEEAAVVLPQLVARHEILVVDDGSRDATAAVVEALLPRYRCLRLLRHATNRGYGAALRTGFQAAQLERVGFTDADCQFHLEDLAALLRLTSVYPLAIGYRLRRQDPWLRRLYSLGFNRLIRVLLKTNVRDCDCALKVFRRDCLADLLPESEGFFVNTEMLTRARRRGYAIAEVGVRHRRRLRGQSTVSLGQIPRMLRVLLPFWWRGHTETPVPGQGIRWPHGAPQEQPSVAA